MFHNAVFCKSENIQLQTLDIFVLYSPHFPLHYSNNINCSWIFSTSRLGVFVIKSGRILRIEAFDSLWLGYNQSITSDTSAYRYPNYKEYAPYVIALDTLSMWILFSTDHFGTSSGFYVTIERQIESCKLNYITRLFQVLKSNFNTMNNCNYILIYWL